MILDLISAEVLRQSDWKGYTEYTLECSEAFYAAIKQNMKDIMKTYGSAFLSPEPVDKEFEITKIITPMGHKVHIERILPVGFTIKPKPKE